MGSLSAATTKALEAIKKQQEKGDDLSKKGHDLLNEARQLTDTIAAEKKRKEGVKAIEESVRVLKRVEGKMDASNAIAKALSLQAAIAAIDADIEKELADAKKHSDKGNALLGEYKKTGDPQKLEQGNDELQEYLSEMARVEGKHEIRDIVDKETQ